jgi:hypothetical protein
MEYNGRNTDELVMIWKEGAWLNRGRSICGGITDNHENPDLRVG